MQRTLAQYILSAVNQYKVSPVCVGVCGCGCVCVCACMCARHINVCLSLVMNIYSMCTVTSNVLLDLNCTMI